MRSRAIAPATVPATLLVLVAGTLAGTLLGCGGKGSITFTLETPADPALSPFADPRRDGISLFDEITGLPLGQEVSTALATGVALPIGDLAVGRYDVRLSVSGGAQLLGLARSRGVAVNGGQDSTVTLHARKPLALFGSSRLIGKGMVLPKPDPLMILDTTLPASPNLPPASLGPMGQDVGVASAATSTHGGLYLLAAPPGRVVVLRTLDFSVAASIALDPIAGSTAPPVARMLVVSRDDAYAAVVTDQGVAVVPLDFLAGATPPTSLPTIKLANLQAAAFTPDGSTLTLLTGAAWQTDCAQHVPSATWRIPLAPPFALGDSTIGPVGATDIGYDRSGALLLAVPCAKDSLIREGGEVVLSGSGIYRVVVDGDRVIGIPGTLTARRVPNDPDNAMVTYAQVETATARGPAATPFAVPPEAIAFQMASDGSPVQIRLRPASLIAYRVAASPDGSHLLAAHRIRYQAQALRFFELMNGLGNLVFYCSLDVARDVYRLTEIDTSSGTVGYDAIKGIEDSKPCSFTCFNCDSFGGGCTANPADSCAVSDGFVPAGLSVLMGAP